MAQNTHDDFRNIADLYTQLSKIDNTPNRMTLAAFRKYEPLFQIHDVAYKEMTTEQQAAFNRLGKDYRDKVDLYKTLEIIKSDHDQTVILTLPPVFAQARSLPNTPEVDNIVNRNTRLAGHDVEKYSAEAFHALAQTAINEQVNNIPAIIPVQKKYRECIADFNKKYGKADAVVTTSPQISPVTEEWSIDE